MGYRFNVAFATCTEYIMRVETKLRKPRNVIGTYGFEYSIICTSTELRDIYQAISEGIEIPLITELLELIRATIDVTEET